MMSGAEPTDIITKPENSLQLLKHITISADRPGTLLEMSSGPQSPKR
jgi:hypothetical protein